ncbi:L-threonylcarbamoyladenylate synthase [Verminephrobacter eiseniae]|uniref:Threonylcarbamoyl-AMP synthase n=3 Tax=Verminephrobacter eiseniae TaxID=364317 RepID=A1WI46_VEREI|nr:L-threonylcarbamoyladenylate synthase [Verminephrobacter eiseniae]ABM57303.1 translation factor SUA5 [Verminephrobacter eiseniae EF01-2]MCW5282930.1 L-threonylcarbamoyladenylate synthase [Verminephrobacter eiseniae]MCW5303245.1 L-threonylcarbamoyladenylate synthase [Verminephrobacter eiseniae]MCW8188638.1 L-threonylcarbamoyladenylate synthase [Verminephrobacter eiseniae]
MILDGHDPRAIAAAARALRSGALLGLPTETVYGLAADAGNDAAVAQIFAAKGRPRDHPLIVHVASAEGIAHFARALPAFAQALADAFWPGPLTLILPRRPGVASAAAGGQDSVGLRCPAHPVAQALLRACAAPPPEGGTDQGHDQGGPPIRGLAAPSANRFGRVSTTTAQHVQDELGAALLVLDGGPCALGIESTIVDCTRGLPVLLRPGSITRAQIAAACGIAPLSRAELPALDPRAPGTLAAHYAPRAKVRLMDARALQTSLDLWAASAPAATAPMAVYARSALRMPAPGPILRRMPDDASATAQQLFAVLRSLDDAGVPLIWIETPPATPDWEGVRDRLQRAAAA